MESFRNEFFRINGGGKAMKDRTKVELGTAAGEYHYILRQLLGKLLVVVATLHSAIDSVSEV